MSSGNNTRKKINLSTVSVSLGCSCTRPKLSLLFHPLKTTKKHQKRHQYSSSSSWTNDDENDERASSTTTTTTKTTTTATTASSTTPKTTAKPKNKKKEKSGETGRGFGRVGGEGVAVEKESDDPFLDFRHSMLQMILENEIYSKDDLRELLNCFLQLNSPTHHGIIVTAFTEIWDGVFSVRSDKPYRYAPSDYDNNALVVSSPDYCYY